MQLVWLGIHIVGVMVCFILLISVVRTRETNYKSALLMTVVCSIIIFVSRCLYIESNTLEELLACGKLEYLGKCYANFCLVAFIIQYCDIRAPKWFLGALGAINSFMFVLIMTCEHHQLYYTSIDMKRTSVGYTLVLGKAPLYYFYMVFCMAELVLFFYYCIRPMEMQYRFKNARMLRAVLCTVAVAPVVMLSFTVFGITGSVDLTPLGVLSSAVLLVLAVNRYGLFDTVSSAKELLVESLEEGIIVSDDEMNFLYANRAACELLPEMNCEEGKVDDWELQALYEQSGTIIDLQDRNYEIRNTEIRDKTQVRGYMISIVDVTDVMSQARLMRELKEKAEHAATVKSAFLANMSHEIRTPMNAILGMAEMALRGNLDEEEKDYIEQIQIASEGLLTIINDILDFSKMESGKMQIVETEYAVLNLIKEVENLVQGKVKDKGLELNIELNPNIPRGLYGDEIRIKQVLINLVNNAVKFTDEGSITVSVDCEERQESTLLKFSVKDTGIGIKEEDLERIFNSFEQSDTFRNRKKEGSGLGLTISRQLLHLMGGNIYVESVYHEGSRFSFEVPQRVTDPSPCGAYEKPRHKRVKKQQEYSKFKAPEARVLIVDDNLVNLRVAAGLMRPFGMQVDTAKSGAEALAKAQEKDYHLIFMDHMMPEMDGVETARKIRALEGGYYKEVPIIALTANAISGAREMFVEEGLNDFIAKPINMKELSDKILEWLPFELLQE
ncbi:MAG: ATP-binding protein [Clostridiales bacterium]|nr:ATP-binding protein [Clostridiales bacterium]